MTTTGRPVGPLQYRLNEAGLIVSLVDIQGNEIAFSGAVAGSEVITGLIDVSSEAADDAANTDTINSFFEAQFDAGGILSRIATAGTFMFADMIDLHPAVSFVNDARGAIILQCGDNMPATNVDGAENSLIRVPARTHDVGGTLSYTPTIQGFNLQGRKDDQANGIHLIRVPNPDPDDNDHDPDPGFTTNKDYASPRFYNIEGEGASGDGLLIEAGRGRPHVQDVRMLGCNGNGFNFKSNDVIVGDRCAAGGNLKHGFLFGSGSGQFGHHLNAWTKPEARAESSYCIKFANSSGFSLLTSMVNDTAMFDGRDEKRAGTVIGNVFSPHDEIFDSDGHAFDLIDGDDDPKLQAHWVVRGYRSAQVAHNAYTRSKKVNFATPSNVGGDTTGKEGTAFKYLGVVTDDAQVAIWEAFTSEPDYRQWSDPSPVPFFTDSGGQLTYATMDVYTCTFRVGAKGAGVNAHVALAIDESVAPDANYAVQIGRTNKRNQINGATEFSHGLRYTDDASDVKVLVNGDNFAINSQKRVQFISCSGTIAAATVTLPSGMTGSMFLDVIFTGNGVITSFTVSGTFASGSLLPPTKINGRTVMRFFYRHDNTSWYLVAVQGPSNPFIVLPYAATLNSNADVGSNFEVTLTGPATLNPPSNAADGQAFAYLIRQDATGGRTLTTSSAFEFEGGAPTLNTDANGYSMLLCIFHAGLGKLLSYGSTSKFTH